MLFSDILFSVFAPFTHYITRKIPAVFMSFFKSKLFLMKVTIPPGNFLKITQV